MTCLLTLWATDTLLVFIKPFTNVSWCLKESQRGLNSQHPHIWEMLLSSELLGLHRRVKVWASDQVASSRGMNPQCCSHTAGHLTLWAIRLTWVSQSFLDFDLQLRVRSDEKRTLELTTLSRQDKSSFPLSYEGYRELHGFVKALTFCLYPSGILKDPGVQTHNYVHTWEVLQPSELLGPKRLTSVCHSYNCHLHVRWHFKKFSKGFWLKMLHTRQGSNPPSYQRYTCVYTLGRPLALSQTTSKKNFETFLTKHRHITCYKPSLKPSTTCLPI